LAVSILKEGVAALLIEDAVMEPENRICLPQADSSCGAGDYANFSLLRFAILNKKGEAG